MAQVALRQEELHAVAPMLDAPGLVTLTGRGGMGKTWLARRLARSRGHWIGCRGATSIEELVRRVAESAGVPTQGQVERDLERAARHLAEATSLVVLDNLEQVVQPAGVVALALVDAGLCVLGTSRVALGVPRERVVPLAPAPVDDLVRLFLSRADPVTVDADAHRADIERIVEAVGGNPLAVEIAAGHTALGTPSQLAARLQADLRLVDVQGRQTAGHASLMEVVETTWSLLSPDSQHALHLACTLTGSFTADEAGALGLAPTALTQLLRWSMLTRIVDRDVRLEVPAEVRATVWAQRPPRTEHLVTHATVVVEATERWQERVGHRDHNQAMRHLSRWYSDLEAVVGRDTVPESLRGRALVCAVRYLSSRHTGQCLALLEDAPVLPADPEARLRLWVLQAQVLRRARRREEADDLLARAEALARTPAQWARIHCERAYRLMGGTDTAAPLDIARDAVACAREAQDDELLSTALYVLGSVTRMCASHSDAVEILERGRAVAARAGTTSIEIQCLATLIVLAPIRGPERTAASYQRALTLARELEEPALEALVEAHYASHLLWAGVTEPARSVVRTAVPALRRVGHDFAAENLNTLMALLETPLQEPDEARRALLEIQRVARTRGPSQYDADLLVALGLCDHREGNVEAARRKYQEASALRAQTGRRFPVPPAALVALASAELGEPATSDDPVVTAAIEAWRGGSSKPLAALLREPPSPAGALRVFRDTIARRALTSRRPWRVQLDGRAFASPAGDVVELGRRRAARRLLVALLETRLERPGQILDSDEMIELGWPGQTILPHAARNRLWAAVKDLRQLGLGDVLQTVDEGYRLDPTAPVEAAERLAGSS